MFVSASYFGRCHIPTAGAKECAWAGKMATSCSPSAKQERRADRFALLLLIFVENHSINHHAVSCANILNPDWSADFHSGPYDIFIEHLIPAPFA
jgi:hypothetical protein